MDSLIRKFRSWTRRIINVRQWMGLRVRPSILFRCMLLFLFLILSLVVCLFTPLESTFLMGFGSEAQAAEFQIVDDLTVPNGEVGIGTTAPAAKLEIKNLTSGTTPTSFKIIAGDTNANFALQIQDSLGADKLVVLDNGKVGIGSTDPGAYMLYVTGDAYLGGLTVNDGTLSFGGDLDMDGNDITNVGAITAGTLTDGTLTIQGGDIASASSITASTLTDGTLEISGGSITSGVNGTFSGTVTAEHFTSTDDAFITDRLRIGSTAAPTVALDVTGDVKISGSLTYSGTGSSLPNRTLVLTAQGAIAPTGNAMPILSKSGSNVKFYTLDFDQTHDDEAYWNFVIPDSLAGTPDLKVKVYWTASAGSVGDGVSWNVSVKGLQDAEVLDAVTGIATEITDAVTAANDLMVTSEGTLSAAAWSPGDFCVVKLQRLPGNAGDTLAQDAKLLMVKLEWPADSSSD